MEAANALAKLTAPSSSSSEIKVFTTAEDFRNNHVISDEEDRTTLNKGSTLQSRGVGAHREIFPERLMAILKDKTVQDVITWLPHGRSFVIIRPDVFAEKVLPKYLPPADARSSTKYSSFTRKLNRWYVRHVQ
jgi:hypothetical protein